MAYFRCGGAGIPASIKNDMNAVLNKKFGTSAQTYPPKEWADDVNLMGLLPIRTASGSIAHFSDGADDVPLKSLTAQILPIQSGTGDPSPSNPRPIIGTSAVNLTRTGANLFNWQTRTEGYRIQWATGRDYADASAIRSDFIPVKEGERYICSDIAYIICYDRNKTYLGCISSSGEIKKQSGELYSDFQIPNMSGCSYIKIMTFGSAIALSSTSTLSYGNVILPYEEYVEPTEYPIALGRTIYGGSADVVGGTGEETYGYIASYNGEEINEPWLSSIDPYVQGTTPSTGAEVVYPLSTPTPFTFTGQEINSYLGVNNVFHSGNGDTAAEYRADIDLLISELGG